jgi:flagellar protein FlaH
MNHLSVGLEARDRVNHAIGGGFPEGSLVLIEGGTGAGKSVLTSRFTYGVCEEETTVSLVSTQLSAREYVKQMYSLSYDVTHHLLDDRLRYFHVPTDGDRSLMNRFLKPSFLWDARMVAVDGFGSLVRNDRNFATLLGSGKEDQAIERIVARLDTALAAGKVLILTIDSTEVTDRALGPLRSAADVYLELQSETVGQEIRKKALVRRFSGMKRPVDDSIGFSVQQGRGVVIESRTIA